jgi:hypothetical protein
LTADHRLPCNLKEAHVAKGQHNRHGGKDAVLGDAAKTGDRKSVV